MHATQLPDAPATPLLTQLPPARGGAARNRRSAELAALLKRLPEPVYEHVPVSSLTLEPEYGRPLRPGRLAQLRPIWTAAATSTIAVSERTPVLRVVIDGGHRVTLAREKGWPQDMHAMVWKGTLSIADEAALYEVLNDELPQTARDIFRARLARGEVQATQIRQAAEDAHVGLNLNGSSSHRGAQCFGALDHVYETYGGQFHLYTTFKFIRSAWGDEPRALRDFAVRAVAAVLKAYPKRLVEGRLRDRVTSIGFSRLLGEANNRHEDKGLSMPVAFGDALVDCYNGGLAKKNQLDEFRGAVPTMPPPSEGVARARPRGAVWNARIDEAESRPT